MAFDNLDIKPEVGTPVPEPTPLGNFSQEAFQNIDVGKNARQCNEECIGTAGKVSLLKWLSMK